ncbi:malonate decarboxylase subunit epsilon [Paraburkholderia caballeronis]|uniref:[acyl-carrier-protein] S-malonyltransferase n=1 Tax=Paraburkholderia caballeronis TaxID=416943 RepID=A0A1H7LZJ7_9BURK|nr:malonate decarboxylase subunit epsilon [Paraburkholderia caballeronis]PXW28642.1 [acyl-carrier-protein] S-malonyltransferase [Paraburkholderia caballeronis]PXX04008.1 [acyl-carrier-protein] S-malonyltransferase [Paraburkholderia caballeronis]RAK04752.1 [acyl-carrier-protein] S-malonyltransferase [Paraburkholderia caballeronis]SED66722.1 [acyl-carrier-protein] S-malonyltransferase [Paraburkholderia caballeronis]SEL03727.1 [acyl-carrier-protein] S-malonyltransferase [Paraburkholderia caballer
MGLAILCSGQGAQRPGMLAACRNEPLAREVIDEASHLIDVDLWRLDQEPMDDRMFQNAIAQPLICATALAAWRVLSSRLPEPVLYAGYSIGELAAYGCAGALSASQTIELARTRAALMDACADAHGGMLAVRGLLKPELESLCTRFGAQIAIENGDDHFVIGGTGPALEQIATHAAQAGASTVRRLAVSIISHTSVLQPAAAALRKRLHDVDALAPTAPVIAGISGAAVDNWPAAVDSLAAQLMQAIRWNTCVEAAVERGATVFLELGPGNSLARMIQESHPQWQARSIGDFRSFDGVSSWAERAMS